MPIPDHLQKMLAREVAENRELAILSAIADELAEAERIVANIRSRLDRHIVKARAYNASINSISNVVGKDRSTIKKILEKHHYKRERDNIFVNDALQEPSTELAVVLAEEDEFYKALGIPPPPPGWTPSD